MNAPMIATMNAPMIATMNAPMNTPMNSTMNARRPFRAVAALFIIIALMTTLLLAGAAAAGCTGEAEPVTREGFFFDTYIRIAIYDADDADAALEHAFSLCSHWDRLWGRDTSGSDVWRINHAGGAAVEVDEETLRLINEGLYYSQLSGGAFDITCGAVTPLWDFSAEEPVLPDAGLLAEAAQTIDYTAVSIDGCSVAVPDGTMLDLGGIAKGYIADRLAEELRGIGVRSAIIDLGGNIFALGSKQGGDFSIAVQSPYPDREHLDVLAVTDRSVVTAGSYERCFELGGRRYHHILSTADGMPVESGIESVTVVSASSCQGDALATICFILGTEAALELVEGIPEAELIIARSDGSTVTSSGYEIYSGSGA